MYKLSFSNKKIEVDTLRVNLNKRRVNFQGNIFRYRDKDTRQIVIHIPSLDLTSYGATEKKAEEMIHFLITDFFKWLGNLPHSKIDTELRNLGWKHVKFKNKEYSQTFIDGDGNLQNFNAVANEVERLTVVA